MSSPCSSHWVRPVALLVAALVSGCSATAPTVAHRDPGRVEILWDTWGVPHLFGRSLGDVAYGLGRAQMRSHGNLLLELYGESRGRAAEYWGEEHLALDKWVRTMSIPQRAADWYAAQDPEERAIVDGFAAGINDYAREHPEQIPPALRVVLPVTGSDVLAHIQRVVNFSFVASAPATTVKVQAWSRPGSNGWAIAPPRSASGNALLLANPHLMWGGFASWFEVQLVAPGVDIYGVTLVGMPIVAIGFNPDLAWTLTVNPLDGVDLFELELGRGGYVVDGRDHRFEERAETLKIKQADGTLREEVLPVRSSIFGPVVGQTGARALAVRVTGLSAPHLVGQFFDMARASTLERFEKALARLQLPMFNVVYADRAGHVMEVFNGIVPRRSRGDAKFWAGVVPGNEASLMWTEALTYAELPRLIDPPSGWLQNANEPPWWMTVPVRLDPSRFAPELPKEMDQFRTQRSIELIAASSSLTLEALVAAKFSTHMSLADRTLGDLLPLAERGSPLARQAAQVLGAWDRSADADSRGGALFRRWARAYFGEDTFVSRGWATPWRSEDPLKTPAGLADPARAVSSLEEAAKEMMAAYGALDVPWGEVNRVRYAGLDLPANGCGDRLGCFDVAYLAPGEGGKYYQFGGDTFIAAVELGPTVRAKVALVYGNSSQPDSRHRGDQLPLVEGKRLRDAWRTRLEIEQHLEGREAF